MKFYGIYSVHSIDRYDAVEVHPVECSGGCCMPISECEFGKSPDSQYMWSVYLHYNPDHPENDEFRGIECAADLPTREAAEAYAEGLSAALASVIGKENIK